MEGIVEMKAAEYHLMDSHKVVLDHLPCCTDRSILSYHKHMVLQLIISK